MSTTKLIAIGSQAMRSKGNILGLFALPIVLALIAGLKYGVYPKLSFATQNAIDNGTPGMLLGMFIASLVVTSGAATPPSIQALWKARNP